MDTSHRHWAPHVLVVDDNRDFADSLALLLEAWGFQPLVAYDGPSAVEVALAHAPDAVLLDLGLPGMDGYEVARFLRRHPGMERAVIIAVTGFARHEDRLRSAREGFDHHLVKPVEPEELRRLLRPLG
jgi:CheY-like chemotaxis protein